jgi:hypothetical protein
MAAYRFSDLLTVLQPGQWKMDDAARESFNKTLESVRAQLKLLEERRREFSYQPDNPDLGDKTVVAISDLLPVIDLVARTVSQYENAASGAQYKQPGEQLADLEQQVKSYLSFLRARTQQPSVGRQTGVGPTPATLQTETITTPRPQEPPATVSGGPGAMESAQIKTLLERASAAAHRLDDLATVLHPERWKLDDPRRNSLGQTLDTLRVQLGVLQEWRSQFERRPDSIYLAYKTYAALDAVLLSTDDLARSISEYEGPVLAVQYILPANQLFDVGLTLHTYLSSQLRNQDQLANALETNLAACQNKLGYAMRSRVEPATPMKNVLPVFKGHRHVHRYEGAAGHTETVNEEKKPHRTRRPPQNPGQLGQRNLTTGNPRLVACRRKM